MTPDQSRILLVIPPEALSSANSALLQSFPAAALFLCSAQASPHNSLQSHFAQVEHFQIMQYTLHGLCTYAIKLREKFTSCLVWTKEELFSPDIGERDLNTSDLNIKTLVLKSDEPSTTTSFLKQTVPLYNVTWHPFGSHDNMATRGRGRLNVNMSFWCTCVKDRSCHFMVGQCRIDSLKHRSVNCQNDPS